MALSFLARASVGFAMENLNKFAADVKILIVRSYNLRLSQRVFMSAKILSQVKGLFVVFYKNYIELVTMSPFFWRTVLRPRKGGITAGLI